MVNLTSNRRLIEDSFPIKEVGVEAAKEKYIRKGNIATLHVWWARRPLSSSRTTIYASLVGVPDDSQGLIEAQQFITKLSKWESTLDHGLIDPARESILSNNRGIPPRVLDPFAGGGAIPLEALRLGCETYSSDLNPVAVLIQKCILEYPFIFGTGKDDSTYGFKSENSPILDDVQRWASWVQDEVRAELISYYPSASDAMTVVGYVWAHTIPCQNPNCEFEIPLMKRFWLVKKKTRQIVLNPIIEQGRIRFEIVGVGHRRIPTGFNPDEGTVSRAVATCLACGSVVDATTVRKLFKRRENEQMMLVVIEQDPKKTGKLYRIPSKMDLESFVSAEKQLSSTREQLMAEWGIDPIPDEPTPEGKGRGAERAFSIRNYGYDTWGDLFNSRQKLALILFTKAVREAYNRMQAEGYKEDYAVAVTSYLALLVSRLTNRMSSLAYWYIQGEKVQPTFVRGALGMVWDYIETNPLSNSSGSWLSNMTDGINVLKHLIGTYPVTKATVKQCSATKLPYPDNYFDAVFTDPPYYDNIPYSHLSDFFYVWLKRSVGHLQAELFSTPLTPKSKEIVAYSYGPGGFEGGKALFEENLRSSFREIHRVLKSNGVAIIVYAHKSTAGWETLINSLLDSGLVVTSAWPIDTELKTRLRARESAALASSIYIITRKIDQRETGMYRDVKRELEEALADKLERLWIQGVGGANYFVAAIGSAIEVFGKYKEVIDYEGDVVRANRLLDDVRDIVTNYAIQQILHNGFSEDVSPLTKFYVLFRWNYRAARITFDEARKLAQSCGIDLTEHWSGAGFIRKEKEFIRVLGPHERKLEHLKGATEMIDIIHRILLLWEKNKRDEISEILTKSGLGRREAFWRVAQAISETLSIQDKEKKLLDGFLAGRNGYVDREQYDQVTVQGTPVKTSRKKKRRGQSPQMDRENEHEQVKLE